MQETLKALLGLQQIDRHIFSVEAELRRLPLELQRRQAVLDAQSARVEELRRRAHDLRSESKEIEGYTVKMRQRQRKLENECASHKIDAAMLAAYQHEIRTLKHNVSQAEDDALEKMELVDALEKEQAEVEAKLTQERSDFEILRGNVETELAAAESRQAELTHERESLSADDIQPGHLELYRRLLQIREGEALAELSEGHCQVCLIQIPKNLGVRLARGGELVQCPSCDRILFFTV